LGYVAVRAGLDERAAILRQIPRGADFSLHGAEIVQSFLALQVGYLISWLLYSFSFAAVCVAFKEIESGEEPSAEECFSPVRDRSGTFLRLTFSLYALLIFALVVASAAGFLLVTTIHKFSMSLTAGSSYWIGAVCIGLAMLAVSRFGLAMPAVVLDRYSLTKALFRSDELTEGCWGILALLLAESVGSSYIATKLEFWLARLVPSPVSLQW
jgi:small-conductance mechanosensitive channel